MDSDVGLLSFVVQIFQLQLDVNHVLRALTRVFAQAPGHKSLKLTWNVWDL